MIQSASSIERKSGVKDVNMVQDMCLSNHGYYKIQFNAFQNNVKDNDNDNDNNDDADKWDDCKWCCWTIVKEQDCIIKVNVMHLKMVSVATILSFLPHCLSVLVIES